MENYTSSIIGIDIDKASLSKSVTNKVRYGNALAMEFPNNFFDKVYALNVIEHIEDTRRFFEEASRVLKPNGRFLLVYPLELFRGMQVLPRAVVIHKNPLVSRKIHIHKFTPKVIKKMIVNTPLIHLKSELIFTLIPPSCHYVTLLEKT